jgi:transcription termination factor Rho
VTVYNVDRGNSIENLNLSIPEVKNSMYNSDIATMMKIQQIELIKKKHGCSAADVGKMFKKYGILDYIDDAYEFLHIQGPLATYDDLSSYILNFESAQ